MNVFTGIMLVFAAIGLTDKIFSLRWGLTESFDKGLHTMGTMVIPIVGVCTVGAEFIGRHGEAFQTLSSVMPFDSTLIVGALLAPDVGGYFVAEALTDSPELLIMNGVVVGTLLGQAVCFQLPVFLSTLDRKNYRVVLKGFLVGMTMIPVGMLAAEAILRMDIVLFLRQFIPVLVICLLIALGLYRIPDRMVKGSLVIGRIIQMATNIMFFIAVLGIFVPALRYVSIDAVSQAVMIVFKSAIIIAGSLVMSELVMKFFRKQLEEIAGRLGTNGISVICILMNCATSLAILPLFDRMDEKGKQLNSAFSISGSYVLGGSMAFVSAVSSGYVVTVFIISKLVSGLLSMFIMHRIGGKND